MTNRYEYIIDIGDDNENSLQAFLNEKGGEGYRLVHFHHASPEREPGGTVKYSLILEREGRKKANISPVIPC